MIPLTIANLNNDYSNANASNITQQLSKIQKVRQLVKILDTENLENVESIIHKEYFTNGFRIDVSSIQDLPSIIKKHKAILDHLTFMLKVGFVVPGSRYESLYRYGRGLMVQEHIYKNV
jgi:hypothetical protein